MTPAVQDAVLLYLHIGDQKKGYIIEIKVM